MAALTATVALQLPVRLQGIGLGRPVDILLETETWHAFGFVVRCRDEAQRFLPYAAAQPREAEIAVGSALLLLEDVGFYRTRSLSFQSLVGADVERNGRLVGRLQDLVLGPGGDVTELVVERSGLQVRIPAKGSRVPSPRASAA